MAKKPPYGLVYANDVNIHLRAIDAKFHSLIQTEIESQLLRQPDVETRNRKPLQRPTSFAADWELRLGPNNCFRVFYQVSTETREVRILAIGVKNRERLYFGGKEFEA